MRRTSFSCSPSTFDSPGGANQGKDRRALLEEWRRQARNNRNASPALSNASDSPSVSSLTESASKKRIRFQDEQTHSTLPGTAPPPLPPASQPPAQSFEGMTAVQRYKLRRQQEQLQQHQMVMNSGNAPKSILNSPGVATTNAQFSVGSALGLSNENGMGSGSSTTRSSPFSRRLSVSGGSRRARRKTMSATALRSISLNTSNAGISEEKDAKVKQQPLTSGEGEENGSVEVAGLRSRIGGLQQRVEQLEKEKMALSISKAPLEARFRQKEDNWAKERAKMVTEIEDLKKTAKEADERYRALENAHADLESEHARLQLEARRAASSAGQQNDSAGAWKRQLQNDRDVQELREKLRNSQEEVKSLKLDKVSLEAEVKSTQMELSSLQRNFEDLEGEFNELEATNAEESDAAIQLEALTTEHIATAAQLNAARSDLAETQSSAKAAMEAAEKKWKKEVAELKFSLTVMKARGVEKDEKIGGEGVEDEAVLRARIEERDLLIAELEQRIEKGEQLRRTMHNRIQELRGNIRVFVRTRPFLPGDGSSTTSSIEIFRDGETLSITDKNSKNQQFRFDKVFPPSSGQDSVFDEVSEFVQSALDGYHVCLFSYGQTGSGKTHTMQGSGNAAMRGIIPRAVEQILSQVKYLEKQKWRFTMTASFLEIYNESLKDLLTGMKKNDDVSTRTRSRSSGSLAIKRDKSGKSYVDGLSKVTIDTEDSEKGMEQLVTLMGVAARTRSVGSTKMNSQSSRSHSVFMLHLHGVNEESEANVQGALNLCDLAGSERLDRSGAGADAKALKETQAINKSLSCLGDVFTALASRAKHVPYRNSKLTYLLQDCLSGDGKALMFVNLSPTTASCSESLCSLRFAQRVNQIELGKPTKHVHYGQR